MNERERQRKKKRKKNRERKRERRLGFHESYLDQLNETYFGAFVVRRQEQKNFGFQTRGP